MSNGDDQDADCQGNHVNRQGIDCQGDFDHVDD